MAGPVGLGHRDGEGLPLLGVAEIPQGDMQKGQLVAEACHGGRELVVAGLGGPTHRSSGGLGGRRRGLQ
jgi:hypothetical protein